MERRWELSDAWVFAAIEGDSIEDGSTLTQVIAKGDGINHAILTEAEFVQAVPRLIAAGLAGGDPVADRYWHTEVGRDLYARCMRRRGLFGWMDVIPRALRRLGPPRDGDWTLAPGVFGRAVRLYREQMAALCGSRRRRVRDVWNGLACG